MRRAWSFIAAACLAWGAGMLVWDYEELVLGVTTPYPALCDVGFLGFAPLFLCGLFVLRGAEQIAGARVKATCNLGLVASAIAICSTIILYEPVVEHDVGTLYLVTALAYPVIYLTILCFGVADYWFGGSLRSRKAYALLLAGFAIMALINVYYVASLLQQSYEVGSALDTFWLIGFALIWLAADEAEQPAGNAAADEPVPDRDRRPATVELVLTPLCLCAIGSILFVHRESLTPALFGYLAPLGAAFVGFLAAADWWRFHIGRRLYDEGLADRRKLRAREQQYQAILDNMVDVYYRTDAEGYVVSVSQSVKDLLGYRPDEAIGKKLADLYADPSERGRFLQKLRDDGGRTKGYEAALRRKDGSLVWVSTNARCLLGPDGALIGVEGTTRDVTERRAAEHEATAAKEEAEIANRAKTEFLANMSHELRTPLNAVIGFSEMIERETFGAVGHERYLEYAAIIRQSGNHRLAIVGDLLDVSKIELGNMETVDEEIDLRDIVESSLLLVKGRAAQSGITLATTIVNGLPKLRGDPMRTKQIILNLLSNAVKFTGDNGTVTTSVDLDDAGAILLSVTDTGLGMTEEELQEITKPFVKLGSSLTRNHDGTGLGLTIVKSLVDMHGGTLDFASEPGRGTTVSIRFPPERVVVSS